MILNATDVTLVQNQTFPSQSDASALVVSAAVARSGVIEAILARLTTRVTRVRSQLLVLVSSVTILSALVKNIGALAMLMPVALRMARKSDASPSVFLMPMAFVMWR